VTEEINALKIAKADRRILMIVMAERRYYLRTCEEATGTGAKNHLDPFADKIKRAYPLLGSQYVKVEIYKDGDKIHRTWVYKKTAVKMDSKSGKRKTTFTKLPLTKDSNPGDLLVLWSGNNTSKSSNKSKSIADQSFQFSWSLVKLRTNKMDYESVKLERTPELSCFSGELDNGNVIMVSDWQMDTECPVWLKKI